MRQSDDERVRLFAAEVDAYQKLHIGPAVSGRYTALRGRDRDWLIAYISGTESTREGIILYMPCGMSVRYAPLTTLPEHDAPCPCGNPNHWLIQYDVARDESQTMG